MLDFEVARWYKLHRWACWTEPTLSAPDHSNHPSVDTQDVSDHPDMSPSTESPVSDVLENAEEPHTFESNWESSLQVPDKSSFLDSPNKSQETCLQKQHNNMTCPSNLHLHKIIKQSNRPRWNTINTHLRRIPRRRKTRLLIQKIKAQIWCGASPLDEPRWRWNSLCMQRKKMAKTRSNYQNLLQSWMIADHYDSKIHIFKSISTILSYRFGSPTKQLHVPPSWPNHRRAAPKLRALKTNRTGLNWK